MSESGASTSSVGRALQSARGKAGGVQPHAALPQAGATGSTHPQYREMEELASEHADGSQTDFTSQYAPGPESARDRLDVAAATQQQH